LEAASGLLETHRNFFLPPDNYLSPEHERALGGAKAKLRATFVKLALDKSDAKKEFAYGPLSTAHISDLFKLSRKIIFPLFGLGTAGTIIQEVLRSADDPKTQSDADIQGSTGLGKEVVSKVVAHLNKPLSEINVLCREGLEHITCSLRLGKYAKPLPFFGKKSSAGSDPEAKTDLGTDAFLVRFDGEVAKFKTHRTDNLEVFFEENRVTPTLGLFIVLYVQFLMLAVAAEVRTLIVFVDGLRTSGDLTRKRFVFPKVKVTRKAAGRLFSAIGSEDIAGEGFGAESGDVFTSGFTMRTNRKCSLFP
jgi:hypothetical protein